VDGIFFLVTLTIILVGLLLLGLSDTVISIADTSVPNNGIAGSVGEADNSDSSSAVITIMIYTVTDE